MDVGLIGINFKTADLFLREAIARGVERAGVCGEFLQSCILLSTCNRTEIYFSGGDLAEVRRGLLVLLHRYVDLPFEHKLYSFLGAHCFSHLCSVAAGLDSAIVGESEIQRQVKEAYARGQHAFSLPSPLHYLFQKALRVAKGARSHWNLARKSSPLFETLWRLSEERLGALSNKKVLLVGYSETNRKLASFLSFRGVHQVVFCTRYPDRIIESARDRNELERWADYDLISCASNEKGFLIHGSGKKNHLIFDLSVPRNVDPSIKGVHLFNLEQIFSLIKTREERWDIEECRAWVADYAFRLAESYTIRKK